MKGLVFLTDNTNRKRYAQIDLSEVNNMNYSEH